MIDIPELNVLEQIARVASDPDGPPLTPAQISAVLAAYNNVTGGDPIGTMRHNPDTGEIAIRVADNGLHLWRITHPAGSHYNDLQPTLDWPEVKL